MSENDELEDALKRSGKKQPDKVIEIRHTEEKGNLQEKLEEREAQLAVLALDKFEGEKKSYLETRNQFIAPVTDEDKKKYMEKYFPSEDEIGDNPEALESAKEKLQNAIMVSKMFPSSNPDFEDDNPEDVKKRPPSGKVGAPPRGPSGIAQLKRSIDEIYTILDDPNASPHVKEEAEKKATQLFKSIVSGRKHAKQKGEQGFEGFGYMMCPECGEFIFTKKDREIEKCPSCGWTRKSSLKEMVM